MLAGAGRQDQAKNLLAVCTWAVGNSQKPLILHGTHWSGSYGHPCPNSWSGHIRGCYHLSSIYSSAQHSALRPVFHQKIRVHVPLCSCRPAGHAKRHMSMLLQASKCNSKRTRHTELPVVKDNLNAAEPKCHSEPSLSDQRNVLGIV